MRNPQDGIGLSRGLQGGAYQINHFDDLVAEAIIQERHELSVAEYDALVVDFTAKADWPTSRGDWTSLDGH